jgi:outer membrane lipoprotein-sorting protein
LNRIEKSKSQKKVFPLRNKFNALLSISVVSIIFLGITYFVGTQLNVFNELETKQANELKENIQEPTTKPSNEKTVYLPPKLEENYDEMTKEEILTKMINTVDNFETATGQFKVHYGHSSGYSLVEYAISLGNKSGGFGKRSNIENGKEEVTFEYYTEGTAWALSEQTKTYMELKYAEDVNPGTPLKIEDAFSVNSEGDNVTNYRERPPIGIANETLFPYEIASNYTRDLSKWEIEKQNEELLGHNTLVIKGTKNHRDFQSFRFWVDKDTGILVKYETYNANGDIVDYLHPTKLEVNVPIDIKTFTPNLEGYEKNDLDRDEPMLRTGNIDELVPEDLKGQWEEAKKKPNDTTVLELNGNWYIYVKKGYLVNYIESNGNKGTLYLAKTSAEKTGHNFKALAEGYKVDTLKIVYE